MITFVILAAMLAAKSPGKEGSVLSRWSSSPPRIDGKADEWVGTDFALWDKGDVNYAFRNDADKLYVLLVFRNPKFLSSIAETGILLYFSAAGKKDTEYGVQFIRRQVPVEEAIAFIEREKALSNEEKTQLRAKPAYNIYDHRVHNKNAKSQPVPSPTEVQPAHFRYSSDQGSFVYEFEVPLRRDQELAAGVGAAPGEAVMVGFEWGGPTKEQLKRAARTSGETSIANEEVARGSVDRMARGRDGSIPPKYSFWAPVQLAEPAR
jgi:hypothetical protein